MSTVHLSYNESGYNQIPGYIVRNLIVIMNY